MYFLSLTPASWGDTVTSPPAHYDFLPVTSVLPHSAARHLLIFCSVSETPEQRQQDSQPGT